MQESLPTRLRVLRAEKGLTLREAARVTGLRSTTLSELERGLTHPRDVTLSRIAKGYGVPVSELIGMSESEPRPKASASPSPPTPPEETVSDEERRHRELVESVVDFLGWRPPDVEQHPEAYRDAMLKVANDVAQQTALERVERHRRLVDDPDQALRRAEQGLSGDAPPADDAQNARGA